MFCASLFLSDLRLYLCAALKPTLKLSVLHSDGKQSLTRTDSVDDISLNPGQSMHLGNKGGRHMKRQTGELPKKSDL